MMMPANFSAVAENEMTYVVGGSLVDVLAPAMTTANWQNVSANVIKIVGNSFLATGIRRLYFLLELCRKKSISLTQKHFKIFNIHV